MDHLSIHVKTVALYAAAVATLALVLLIFALSSALR